MSRIAELRRRFASGGWVIADQALVSGVSFATTVILVRTLGLEAFGRFSLVAMGVVFAQSLQQAFIGKPLLTIGPKEEARGGLAYYAGALRLEFAFLALLCVVGAAAMPLLVREFDLASSIPELVAGLAFAVARSAHDFVRQQSFARERRRAAFALDSLAYGGQLLVLLALAFRGHLTVFSALVGIASASAVGAAVGLALYGRFRAPRGTTRAVWNRHVGMSRWLVALAFLQWCTTNVFALAAGTVLGPGALGAIKAGQTAMGFLHVLLLSVENVLPVRAAVLAARGAWEELARYHRRVFLVGGALTLVVSGSVASCPEFLAKAFYGVASVEAVLAIRGFALLYVFAFVISVLSIQLRTRERTRPIFVAQGIAAAAALVAARPMVEVFGFNGAICGMILQQAVIALALWLAVRLAAREDPQAARVLEGSPAP